MGRSPVDNASVRAPRAFLVMRPLMLLNRVIAWTCLRSLFVLILAMSIVVLTAVYYRYVVRSSIAWGEELARVLMIWMTFLGMVPLYFRNAHIGLFVVRNRAPRRAALAMLLLSHVAVAWVAIFLVLYSIPIVGDSFARGQTTPALGIPRGIVTLSVLVGGVGLLSVAVEKIFLLFVVPDESLKSHEDVTPEGM